MKKVIKINDSYLAGWLWVSTKRTDEAQPVLTKYLSNALRYCLEDGDWYGQGQHECEDDPIDLDLQQLKSFLNRLYHVDPQIHIRAVNLKSK